MSSPILPKQIDITKLKYSEVKTLSSGAKTIYINYGSFGKLRVQTPVMVLPYGIGEGYEDKTAAAKATPKPPTTEKKYDLTLSFKGIDENTKIKTFHDKLKEIENKIIDDAFTNRQEWFKDDYDNNKAILSRLFYPIIKIDKDKTTGKPVGKYPPTLKVKVPYNNEASKFLFDAYNMENDDIEFETIIQQLKGGRTQLIIELTGIWMSGGKFGCSWKIISGKFQPSMNQKITFLEDSDTEKVIVDDEEGDENEVSHIETNIASSLVLNSDDEEDDDDYNDGCKTPEKKPEVIEAPPAPKKATKGKGGK